MDFLLSKRPRSLCRRLLLTSSMAAFLMFALGNTVWAQSVPQAAPAAAPQLVPGDTTVPAPTGAAKTAPTLPLQTAQTISVQTAQAADTPQTAQAGAAQTAQAGTESITVTGTRISAPGLTSANPIDTITSVEIEDTGLQNLSEILSERPQFQNNQTPGNSAFFINGADINAANLRGLGPYRTLTLIDGVRQVGTESGVNNSGGTGIVDLNTIPPLLIDSIDVVTGGESAIYGADAVAGVLNFKLKKNYEGAEATAEYGTTTDGGGTTTSFDGIFGANFAQDRGNLTFTMDYAKTATIEGWDRPAGSLSAGGANNPVFTGLLNSTVVCCFANPNLNQSGAPIIATALGPNGSIAPLTLTFNRGGTQLLPFNPGTPVPGLNGLAAFAGTGESLDTPTGIVAPDNLRFVDEGILTYKLADDFGPFQTINFNLDAKYASSRGKENGNNFGLTSPPAAGNITGQITVPVTSVFTPVALQQLENQAGVTSINLNKSLDDWDAFTFSYDYELYRSVVGFDGQLKNGWNYNVYYNFGRYENTFINTAAHLDLLNEAVDAVINPATGKLECADTLINQNDGCIPINPFQTGPLTQAQQRFVFFDTKEVDVFEENDAAVNLNGEVIHYPTPFSQTDVALSAAFGLEWREENTNAILDSPSQLSFGTQGQNLIASNEIANLPTAGIYTTKEVYGELRIPILRDLAFAQALDLDGAIRGQDFSTTGTDYTWDASATWKITSDITARGSAGKSVRAPNADELFSGGAASFVGLFDPCTTTNINSGAPSRPANCEAHGVPVGGSNPLAGAPATFITGNPALTAETGRSFTGGFVFTPTFAPHFASTVDFYQIHINNVIGEANPDNLLLGCYDDNVAADCAGITRRPDGSLSLVATPYVNEAEEIIRGADFTNSYRLTDEELTFLPPESRINLGTTLSWIPQHFILQNAATPNAPGSDLGLAGQFGFPRWSGSFREGYDQGPMSFSVTERFIGPTTLFIPSPPETFSPTDLPTVWYVDLSASYRWQNLVFTAGVQNVFDQLPPPASVAVDFVGPVARPVEEPVTGYDATGRFVFTKLKVEF
jgi:iron complex outermembrane receptor protein